MVQYKFLLFIAGPSPNSTRAINNFETICKSKLDNNYQLDIVDVTENPGLAEEQRVMVSPTLIMTSPTPVTRVIGDFSDAQKVISGLGLYPLDHRESDVDSVSDLHNHPLTKEALKILLIEDNPADVVLLREMLKIERSAAIEIVSVENLSEGIRFLSQQRVDVILLDLSLPDSTGIETFRRLQKKVEQIPVIILSGFSDEKTALDSVREGAQDYLVKGEIDGNSLRRSIRYAIERTKIEKELKESQIRADLLIEKNTDGIVLVDKSGMIRFANPAAERLLGAPPEELMGSAFGFPVSGKNPVEIELIRKGSTSKIAELSAAMVEMNNQRLYLASLRDITDRKQTEKENLDLLVRNEKIKASETLLKIKAQALEQESLFKSQFLANMSHELRSPLNSIILLSESLYENQEENLTPEQVKFANIIHNSGKDLLELINQILNFSKLDAGKMPVSLSQVQLHEWAQALELAYGEITNRKGIKFNVSMAPSIPERITTDRQKLGQIIRNLVSNALKFTSQGSITVKIHRPSIEADLEKMPGVDPKRYIAISVIDTGIGISEEYHTLIFQAFQQIDGSASREYDGSGLGLSISKKLAELLHGSIMMESKPQNGSRFTLYLPETIEETHEIQSEEQIIPKEQEVMEISEAVADRLAGIRVLIVDDDMRSLFSMAQILEKYKIRVEKSETGITALQIIETASDMDLILVDIMMPKMDGYETIKKLKSAKGKKQIPIIAMTTKAQETDRIECLRVGADGYVSKPVNINTLLLEINGLIQ